MIYVLYVYFLLTLITGGSALLNGAIYAGVAGVVGPTLCWVGASGLKGSLMVGTRSQKRAGFVLALISVTIGVGLVYHSGFWLGFFGHTLSGVLWCVVGIVVGWVSTARRHAEGI